MGQFLFTVRIINMSDAAAAAPAKSPKAAKKATKPKAKLTHPKTSVMVVAAIKALKERNGSSLPAIKKYIAANYKVDTVKLAPFIKKALKSMVRELPDPSRPPRLRRPRRNLRLPRRSPLPRRLPNPLPKRPLRSPLKRRLRPPRRPLVPRQKGCQ